MLASILLLKRDDICLWTLHIRYENTKNVVYRQIFESLRHIMMAVSWGGHESLVIRKCAGIQPKDFDPANREHRYIRMYVGLEEPGYLIADLEQALQVV